MTSELVNAIQIPMRRRQRQVICCDKRFRVLVAGRKFGKTRIALIEVFRSVCARNRMALYVAPTYRQAKRIAWRRLKDMLQPYGLARVYESELRIEFPWGSTIALRGADNYDSLRGECLDFVALDEYASMRPQVWTEVLRPALADRQGRALFIGTPKGHNHFHELFEAAQHRPDWQRFQFTTEEGSNVTAEELQAAAQELDERTYRQEFQASFENLVTGRVYFAFDAMVNVRPLTYTYRHGLFWALDFNVNPLCAVVGQVIHGDVHVLDEIVLAESNTMSACQAFLEWVNTQGLHYQVDLSIYGDASGDSHHTSSSRTDWQIVRDFLDHHRANFRTSFLVPTMNPPVKDRTNCVNAMLRNYFGQRRLHVDPRCKHLICDLEQVCWQTDANNNPLMKLDKSDPMRTHVSDALGYMISYEFPMQAEIGYRRERLF